MRFTKENASAYGKKGGQRTLELYGRDHFQQIGRRGGQALVETRGVDYMRQIGKRGFAVTVQRHWKGDRQACIAWLQQAAWAAQDPFPGNGAFPPPPPWPSNAVGTAI